MECSCKVPNKIDSLRYSYASCFASVFTLEDKKKALGPAPGISMPWQEEGHCAAKASMQIKGSQVRSGVNLRIPRFPTVTNAFADAPVLGRFITE